MRSLIEKENNIMKYKITYKYSVHFPDPRKALTFVREMDVEVKDEKQLYKELERFEADGKREVIEIRKIENG
jgi:hypothetical protein|nr:MAG TPA: hypothetical protein [Caudoviricetes sp.]DAS14846.1 MAG TPA: hypothetical protein [Caudoviricetes sp.]